MSHAQHLGRIKELKSQKHMFQTPLVNNTKDKIQISEYDYGERNWDLICMNRQCKDFSHCEPFVNRRVIKNFDFINYLKSRFLTG